jgi:glucose/arabinose dehydrogenase
MPATMLRRLTLAIALATCLPLAAEPVVSGDDVPVLVDAERNLVIEGLEHPWGMAFLPDGAILVTERPGRLRVIRDGKLEATPVAGVPEVLALGQGGLLDVAVDPGYADNRTIYLTYAHGTREANRTRVARASFDGKALSDLTVILEATHDKAGGAHFGSRIAFMPDGTMLVSFGDGGNPPVTLDGKFIREYAQDRTRSFGKIVRINTDGSVPKDNPWAGAEGFERYVWSYGHRNVQGMAVTADGQVWASEHGALGGDELNRIDKGANYGWPEVTFSREYVGGKAIGEGRARADVRDAAVVWTPSIAPSGLTVYSGKLFKDWAGRVLAGSLIKQEVRVMRIEDGKLVDEQGLRFGARVRDVREAPDGAIWVITDERNGRAFRLVPRAPAA